MGRDTLVCSTTTSKLNFQSFQDFFNIQVLPAFRQYHFLPSFSWSFIVAPKYVTHGASSDTCILWSTFYDPFCLFFFSVQGHQTLWELLSVSVFFALSFAFLWISLHFPIVFLCDMSVFTSLQFLLLFIYQTPLHTQSAWQQIITTTFTWQLLKIYVTILTLNCLITQLILILTFW